jgi:histidine triad (HIT) family protein
VVSKTAKARNLLEIEPEVLCEVMRAVQIVSKAVVKALRPDGLVVTQFNGAPAGQTVFHLHVHVIPRWEGQPLAGHAHGQMADVADLQRTAAAIAAAL